MRRNLLEYHGQLLDIVIDSTTRNHQLRDVGVTRIAVLKSWKDDSPADEPVRSQVSAGRRPAQRPEHEF